MRQSPLSLAGWAESGFVEDDYADALGTLAVALIDIPDAKPEDDLMALAIYLRRIIVDYERHGGRTARPG